MSVFPSLKIGNLQINPPIIQGGMGERVSLSNLASAVANEGGIGIIASAGIGEFTEYPDSQFVTVNENAFVFAGSNVRQCEEIVKVQSLINQLTKEYEDATVLSY